MSKERVNNWLNKFGMKRHQIHCSGHAKGKDLLEIAKSIDAKMLFPVHTEVPERYVRATRQITIVQGGLDYDLRCILWEPHEGIIGNAVLSG